MPTGKSIISKNMFEHFFNIICDKRETNDAWQSGISVQRVDGQHNRTHTVRVLTARYLQQ